MWCLCLNHLLLSSECNGTLLQCICDNACELEIQLVLYQTQNNQIVNDIQKQSLEGTLNALHLVLHMYMYIHIDLIVFYYTYYYNLLIIIINCN